MSDLYLREDICNALAAADEATSSTASFAAQLQLEPILLDAYMQGYREALDVVALAFGLSPSAVDGRERTVAALPVRAVEIDSE